MLKIQKRILQACERAGRDPAEVTLVAVTKGHDVSDIERVVLSHGHRVLGENRVQEWRDKSKVLENVEWHFIGNLQTNKVKYCTPFSVIHSLNSVRLADAMQTQGERREHVFRVMVECERGGRGVQTRRGGGKRRRRWCGIRGVSPKSRSWAS